MKCYSVYGYRDVRPYLTPFAKPYPHVPVGEEGRGRHLVRVPLGRRLIGELGCCDFDTRIQRASLIKTREKGTLLLVEERSPEDQRAIVLLGLPAGYRGGTYWTAAEPDGDGCWRQFPPAGVTLLAEGYCAQGQAGRMGGHAEYLAIMEPGTCVRVERTGRLYGEPGELFVRYDGKEVVCGTKDEVFPPTENVSEDGELL